MKKIKLVTIITPILIMLLITTLILINLFTANKRYIEVKDKVILLEKYSYNYAWGFYYQGKFITNDGVVHSYDLENYKNFSRTSKLKNDSDYLIKISNLNGKQLSEEELEKLKKNIANLKDTIKIKNVAIDAGNTETIVWNYTNNKRITLKINGDFEGENKTEESREILKIVNKYLK